MPLIRIGKALIVGAIFATIVYLMADGGKLTGLPRPHSAHALSVMPISAGWSIRNDGPEPWSPGVTFALSAPPEPDYEYVSRVPVAPGEAIPVQLAFFSSHDGAPLDLSTKHLTSLTVTIPGSASRFTVDLTNPMFAPR